MMSRSLAVAARSALSTSALVIAHPGHELRIYGWLEREHPDVFILTDGSGHGGASRLPSTARLLDRAGARPGSIFGRFSDRELYRLLLAREVDVFLRLAEELADALAERGVAQVASDALEGYNPSHDLCRVLTDAAAALASRRTGRPIDVYDFPLEAPPDHCPEPLRPRAVRFELQGMDLERKLEAARSYPEMAYEVERNLNAHGTGAFAVECLRPVAPPDGAGADLDALFPEPPYYERYGERQVAEGHYESVLRFREHFLPVARALCELGRCG
jgi:hypothetical protein